MATANYGKALELMAWLKGQYAVTDPVDHEKIQAAAIAAHLNAKDATIARLIWKLDDLGYPRTNCITEV